jgi:peptidoglycan/LPS O-acetylase OafA/YrhL
MSRPRTARGDTFHADIEGLRGLAVGVVVLFHAGLLGMVGGYVGVDVFFVISGFLITGLLLRERTRTGRISLAQFYARRARRILPAAVVVLVVTLIGGLSLAAPLDRPGLGLDAASAALSAGNLRFALEAGDYFATASTPSPFLHYWSLAVEEQFYLIWPALILIVARSGSVNRRVAVAIVGIIAASFATNVFLSDSAVNWAFYSLPTRAWELGLGGLLAACAVGVHRVPTSLRAIGGWVGLAAIAIAVVMFDASITYPGVAALLPALGATLVIAAGSCRVGPGRILELAPLRAIGRISFSLYLVHWPILVLVPIALGLQVDDRTNALLVLLAVVTAAISWAVVETPFRTGLPALAARPRRTLSLSLSVILAVAVVAALPSLDIGRVAGARTAAAPSPTDLGSWPTGDPSTRPDPTPENTAAGPTAMATPRTTDALPGATDLANHGPLPDDVRPALAAARQDQDRLRDDGCLAFEDIVVPPHCVYGPRKASFTIALVGDSHAAQWFPALERLARHEGWRIVTFVKVSCPLIDMTVRNLALERTYRECSAFDQAAIEQLSAMRPDLTIVSMSRIAIHPVRAGDDTVAAKGAAVGRMVSRIPGRVAIIVDTPFAGIDVPACLSAHARDVDACTIPRSTAFSHDFSAIERTAAAASGAALIDLSERICADDPCPVVIDQMIVFRDKEHLTATFSASLAAALDTEIKHVLEPAGGRGRI